MKRILLISLVVACCVCVMPSRVRAHGDAPSPTPSPTTTPTPNLRDWVVITPTVFPAQPGAPAGDPGAAITPQPAPAPTAVPVFGGTTPDAAPTPTAAAVHRALIVRVCLDANANRWCDADEGIAGMQVVIQDGDTGLVRGTSLTDRTGTAQRTVLVRPDQALTVNIPYLGTFHTFTNDRQPEPVLVEQVPPLPALLP